MPLGRKHPRRSRDAPTGGFGLERSTSNLGWLPWEDNSFDEMAALWIPSSPYRAHCTATGDCKILNYLVLASQPPDPSAPPQHGAQFFRQSPFRILPLRFTRISLPL